MRTVKATWAELWERQVEAWKKTPAGQATTALYAAAEKAGFGEALRSCQAEVVVSTYEGKTIAYPVWEQELREIEEFVFPEEAFARAEAWVAKYAAKKGWKTSWV